MRRTAALVAILFTAALARAEETNAPAGAPPSMRGSAGEAVRPVDPPPPAPVPVDIPSEAEPVVSTETVEKMGMDGIAAFEKGNFQGAKEAYVRVLKVEPNNLPALVNLGSTEYRLGNNEEAERLLRRSLQIKPDNPTAWLNLGMVYLGSQEPMRALASIAQAVVHAGHVGTCERWCPLPSLSRCCQDLLPRPVYSIFHLPCCSDLVRAKQAKHAERGAATTQSKRTEDMLTAKSRRRASVRQHKGVVHILFVILLGA